MAQATDVFPLEMAKSQFEKITRENGLSDSDISVLVKTLSPEEAIGVPGRRDFPIVEGKERVVEADFQRGQRPMPLRMHQRSLLEN
jgi:hypothetical protein